MAKAQAAGGKKDDPHTEQGIVAYGVLNRFLQAFIDHVSISSNISSWKDAIVIIFRFLLNALLTKFLI